MGGGRSDISLDEFVSEMFFKGGLSESSMEELRKAINEEEYELIALDSIDMIIVKNFLKYRVQEEK